jgi:hypothetical protein
MHKHSLILVAFASLLLGACVATVRPAPGPAPEPAGPPPRTEVRDHRHEPRVIEGRVFDAETRQPLDRAAVDITSPSFAGERTVNTGPDGRYRTEEIPRGQFGFRCRREGYETFTSQATMNDGIAHIDCEMHRKRH